MNPLAPPVQAHGLTLHAAGRCLLRELHWQAHADERWCIVGRNAAGKSTLLRALAGLPVPQAEGEVRWFGSALARWSAADAARVRAYVPQHASDRFPMPVRRLLELSAAVSGPLETRPADETLAALDALHLAGRDVTRLSGGERQRVALAQCLLQGTPLMLMDEPVSFQDPAHQQMVARWLAGNAARAQVFSAHDVNWIAQAATHVLALFGDGSWAAGAADDLLTADTLQRAYGCAWRQVGGFWQPC
jgi:iron complex transport system ATP-binding protein